MDVAVVIVEQLDVNGALRSFRMQAAPGERLTVALAGEYEEPRSGPFHFLDGHHEHAFQTAFADCRVRRLSNSRFSNNSGLFHFITSWVGIPTEKNRLSYYALCLPEHAIPISVRFTNPRNGAEYRKAIVRDDQRERYVLYLECRSSYGTFDFALEADFHIAPVEFPSSNFKDGTTLSFGEFVDAYEHVLPPQDRALVQQFFAKEISVGDQYNVSGQVGAIGLNARAENNAFNQALHQAAASIDLRVLANELNALRISMRQQATEVEHDQAIVNIGAAEGAAKMQDGAAALGYLKSAGIWAFDVATKIGTSVAAKAIQTSIGL